MVGRASRLITTITTNRSLSAGSANNATMNGTNTTDPGERRCVTRKPSILKSGLAVSRRRVRTSVAPGRASDSTADDPACGSSGCGLFGHEDPFGCWLRMSLLSELEATTGYTMRWKRKVTPSGRSWWVLGLSAHSSRVNESGLSPTFLPRPVACDHKGSGRPRKNRGPGNNLRDWFRQKFGMLYPPVRAVEWLMGYPAGWTALPLSATPSSRKSRRRSSGPG